MLDLNAMRAEFAAYLTDNFHKSKSLDAALMHVLTRAYEQGLADGAAQPETHDHDPLRRPGNL